MRLFHGLQFEYSGMSSKPIGYHYEKFKDDVKWKSADPKDYRYIIDSMFNTYRANLPDPKKN